MNYWKSFKVEELFKRDNSHKIKESQKQLDIKTEKTANFSVAITDAGGTNNGVAGWIDKQKVSDKSKINSNKITIAIGGNASGCCFYHNYDFISTRSNSMLIFLNDSIKNILSLNDYAFLAKFLTLIYHNRFHGFMREMGSGNDFNREIILLPVRTCLENEEAIWTEDDGTPITLDIEKIQEIMKKVENRKKEKTINKYEAEKAKYELEKAKYDEDQEFIEKYKKMYWKSYRVGDLFGYITRGIKIPEKDLDKKSEKENNYSIEYVSSSNFNKGVTGFLNRNDVNTSDISKKAITLSRKGTGGSAFYHSDEFTTSYDNVRVLKFLDNLFEKKMTDNSYEFLALSLTKIFVNKYHTFLRSFISDFDREIILLPVLQDDQGNEEIFTDAMAYLYLKSMILKQDKKIQNYNNKIKELKGE